ncbi:MAG: tetratricopeptide repeat protein, partial [Gemmatimonadales bacterium]
ALVEAANARIAECLFARRSSTGFTEPPAVERPAVDQVPILDVEAAAALPEAVGVTEVQTASGDDTEAITDEDSTELEGHYFRARLAQYRIRRAEDRHTTDFGAHAELGAAYAEMDLLQEAVREFAVAVKGPRPTASQASRSLRRLGESPDTLPELAIHIVEVLSAAALDELADELARTLADSWGGDHPLAARLQDVRADIERAADQLPSLESLFPGVGVPKADSNDLRELDELLSELEQGEPSDEIGEALRVDDEHIQVLREAEAHRKGGRLEEAEAVLYALLDQLQESRRPREAMTVVDRLLILRPEEVVLYHQKTELALMVNDRQGLLAAFAQLGACLRRQGATRGARTAFGRMLDFDPANEEARAAIADIDCAELELEREAASRQTEVPRRTLASDVERSEFDAMLDDLGLEQAEDPEADALDEYTGVELHDADSIVDADSHFELGLAFRQMGMWEEAVAELRAALPHLENASEALEALGESLHRAGKNEEAIAELAPRIDVAADDSTMVGALYYLAQAMRAEGRDSDARDSLARVETASPGYRDAAELLSELST